MDIREFDRIIDYACEEDFGNEGDITSDAIFSDEVARAVLISKDHGVLAGSFLFAGVFGRIEPAIRVEFFRSDGDSLAPMERVAVVEGPVGRILQGERIALNFLSFLSGIASVTRRCVEAVGSGKTLILDTRKTIPGFRKLSKYAVRMGGGKNHRMGLYDMILIKDNHIDASGGITEAVAKVKKAWGSRFTIEVECRSLEDVKEALRCGVDIILLDNMDSTTIGKAVELCCGKVKCEASGNMNEERIREVSGMGVDYISVGMITKSVCAFDFSLDIMIRDAKKNGSGK
ncbi:MAG: carboxylating nicotinate-nucleotide diphosphorylase [Spirochaetales bacterium]|nr:carboxylating nicotinate-nucleotide diphosphorylase [Spirochaetales bacterium]